MGHGWNRLLLTAALFLSLTFPWLLPLQTQSAGPRSHLQRAAVFMMAADYRHALEACQAEVRESPSARSYTFLTYVYHALDGYVEHLAGTDQWVRVEQLYLNLAAARTEDWLDPPDALARMAREIIQQAAQRQADVTAAMANRLDHTLVTQLWQEQTAWRQARPADWWAGVPPQWQWARDQP